MHEILDFVFRTLTNPDRLIEFLSTVMTGWAGYALLFSIVFSETGLLVGFFLPGDSLLFTVGVVAGAGQLNIGIILILLTLAAITGVASGYSIGRRTGPKIFNRPDSRFFKQDHLRKTQAFYAKHGGKTIVYAQFVPIIRTFAPFIAGVAKMPYHRFAMFNVFGSIGWVFSMTMLGYTMGNIELVRKHFEKFVILIVLISVLPIIIEVIRSRRIKPALRS
jgi:membrane-associated protein